MTVWVGRTPSIGRDFFEYQSSTKELQRGQELPDMEPETRPRKWKTTVGRERLFTDKKKRDIKKSPALPYYGVVD